MNFNEYDAKTEQTAVYPGQGTVFGLMYVGLGCAGEAGEAADKIKKVVRDFARSPTLPSVDLTPEHKDMIISELGDNLWYISRVSNELGFTLEYVAEKNVEKISRRKANGTIHGFGDDR